MTTTTAQEIDRSAALERFRGMRARTRAMFDVLDETAYYDRPIPLRNPVVFYEGHLPAFAVNTLLRRALGRPGIDARLEEIFARGIDPDIEAAAVARGNPAWPSRATVRAYASAADRAIEAAIASAPLDVTGHPTLHRGQALWTILEHEEMHQETLAYMWHEVPCAQKRKPIPGSSVLPSADGPATSSPDHFDRASIDHEPVEIPPGMATLGTGEEDAPFGWDNERGVHQVRVPGFAIDRHDVTNAQFMAFVEAGGYRDERWWRPDDWAWIVESRTAHPRFWEHEAGVWYWRGMFDRVPLPPRWPVYVTWAEAQAYARWRGMRLPTEAEFHRAAFGSRNGGERRYPWGNTLEGPPPVARNGLAPFLRGNFDFVRWDPEPVGSHPEGASDFGVHDLVGNGWEWTSTVFGPFDGFTPLPSYPEYSADFFDGDHFVMKGASPFTARALTRRGFRNWFRPRYPYVYATFRCVPGDQTPAGPAR
jgi:ergothioneine biosynthesis protein EgtB